MIDWEGYTIGYYGRPFQTRNKVKGGAFDSTEADLCRWVVGSGEVVAAIDEGVQYMQEVRGEMPPIYHNTYMFRFGHTYIVKYIIYTTVTPL